ncbi:DUF6702 family protein [Spongiimicrobium sp. 2-473A-2-J]|uniref:DUF6702 family protein n=1 Tax=Eudoraea algarum TaxID=3417568 RepID=UPI003D35AD24
MKNLKKGLLILALPLVAFTTAHKFYVSVTNINYSDKDDALQITTRIFIDDFEQVLEERYGFTAQLATDEESTAANTYIEKYLRAKFVLQIDGENRSFVFLGKKYDNDVMVCYLEIPEVQFEKVKSIEVQNEILTDLFDEQQNIVHFKLKGKKKSFVLVRENNKGMLNL